MPSPLPAFAERWSVDDLPACPVGLSFLRQLSETEPRLYAMAEHAVFSDPTDAELATHPLWLAFLGHYTACDNCNEI